MATPVSDRSAASEKDSSAKTPKDKDSESPTKETDKEKKPKKSSEEFDELAKFGVSKPENERFARKKSK